MTKPERNSIVLVIIMLVIAIGAIVYTFLSLEGAVNLNTCSNLPYTDPQFTELKCNKITEVK